MKEEWRDIPGYEGKYQVSNHGRVKSMGRCWETKSGEICTSERVMAIQLHDRGYMVVHLRRPGEHKKFFVHRLVALAFIPNPEEKEVVNHKDRDKKNNVLSNLEWLTFSENTAHWMKDEAEVADAVPF